ncbi:MAG TPA: hypothetical protein VIV40_21895 [Kofleriaceae bacterium]
MMGPTTVVGSSAQDKCEVGCSLSSLERARLDGRDLMLIVAEEPLRGRLLELAHANGFQGRSCRTPLDAVHMLVQTGHRVACAIVTSTSEWAARLAEFMADEFPRIERIQIAA